MTDDLELLVHDLNNLLGVIMNFARFVSEEVTAAAGGDVDRPWDVVRSDVAQLEQAAERAVTLSRQLQGYAEREAVNGEG